SCLLLRVVGSRLPSAQRAKASKRREFGMRAAIYLRVSTEEQRERQSIQTQRDFGERYCALHEIPVHDFYADDGVTGTLPLERRPEGARLLEDAKAKKFDLVLI